MHPCIPMPEWARFFLPNRVSPFAFARGPWLVALALAAMAPAVRGQVVVVSGVLTQRTDTTYYVGLFSGAPVQIISTDANGIRTVQLDGNLWSYQVTPYTTPDGKVSVADQMFLPLEQAGTGVLSGASVWEGSTFTLDPLGPFSGDKVADQSTTSGFISANNGGTVGTFVSSGIFETRDNFNGVFLYYYTLSVPANKGDFITGADGHTYFTDSNVLTLRDQTYEMAQDWNVNFNVVGSTLTNLGPIPEPSTYAALLGLGALGFAAYRRRRRQAA